MPLSALPDVLRHCIEREFFPMHWDDLSADQRRNVALQSDYQHDPAAEQDRQVRVDHFPERRPLVESKKLLPPPDVYIAYPKAMKILAERWSATPDELTAWIFLGPDMDGITAYRHANELIPPPRFHFDCFMGEDYLSPLMGCWFRQDEIGQFEPADRYITGAVLIERWGKLPGIVPDAFICAKIAESRLLDIHPTFGCTQGSNADEGAYPPLSAGLFALSHVEQIEIEDALESFTVLAKPAAESQESLTVADQPEPPPFGTEKGCAVFREMDNLRPSDITISIVGDTSEAGLSGNSMLEISARDVIRRLTFGEVDLVDRRNGALNQQAAVLVGLAQGRKITHSESKYAAIMKRLRAVFRKHLGVKADPFKPHSRNAGWEPLFIIADLRGRADERARLASERRTVSFDRLESTGRQFAATDANEHSVEDDDAERWLEKNDPHH